MFVHRWDSQYIIFIHKHPMSLSLFLFCGSFHHKRPHWTNMIRSLALLIPLAFGCFPWSQPARAPHPRGREGGIWLCLYCCYNKYLVFSFIFTCLTLFYSQLPTCVFVLLYSALYWKTSLISHSYTFFLSLTLLVCRKRRAISTFPRTARRFAACIVTFILTFIYLLSRLNGIIW